jgi:hypothetical protein
MFPHMNRVNSPEKFNNISRRKREFGCIPQHFIKVHVCFGVDKGHYKTFFLILILKKGNINVNMPFKDIYCAALIVSIHSLI